MKTSELIEFYKSQPFTETQGYNLLVDDLYEEATEEDVSTEAGQKIIQYFFYKVQSVLFPVIQDQKEKITKFYQPFNKCVKCGAGILSNQEFGMIREDMDKNIFDARLYHETCRLKEQIRDLEERLRDASKIALSETPIFEAGLKTLE